MSARDEPPYDLDIFDPDDVADLVVELTSRLFARVNEQSIRQVFRHTEDLFQGRKAGFQAADTSYHNLEHTMRATVCWARLFEGYTGARDDPALGFSHFRKGLVAILMHDTGFLKREMDVVGTGAKYADIHERRSCEMAERWLARAGWTREDIRAVRCIICCTGVDADLGAIPFADRAERLIGQMVCTADYLGQMSDPAYIEKLPELFLEIEESDEFRGIPPEHRLFRSVNDLITKTPAFWTHHVRHKLDDACGGVYRYLARPWPDGPNPYMDRIRESLDRIGNGSVVDAT
ncbi:MAG: hypothetical protein JJU00_08590 [Opitutales bacterium]|nr:hypothetical protein [Opitutales bacterium]